MNTKQNLTESDGDNIDFVSPLKHQNQKQQMNDSGWWFDKFNSMTIYSYKIEELNGSPYVKMPLRNSFILNFENVKLKIVLFGQP